MLIDCFLNNPDHWYSIKKPEDLKFKVHIDANWNEDPEILKRLNERKEKNLKDNYLYPFGMSKFHRWANENNEPKRSELIANKTEKDLFNRAFTEDQMRKEQKEKHKQRILSLKPIYLARVDKEYRDIVSPKENKIAIKKLRKIIENEYIDFQEDVILHWTGIGDPSFEDRQGIFLISFLNMIMHDRDIHKGNEEVGQEEGWRKRWRNLIKYGDYKSKKIELETKLPEDIKGFDSLIEEIRRRYPDKIERIEEHIDNEFKFHSIRNIMKNKDYFKAFYEEKPKLCIKCGKEHYQVHAYCEDCWEEIKKNNQYAKTCFECGKVHEERYSYCKECWDKMTKICPSCGREHIEYDKYCYSCSFKQTI